MKLRTGALVSILALAGAAAAETAPRVWSDQSWLTGLDYGLWCLPVVPDSVSDSPDTIIGETDRYDAMPDLVLRTQTVPLADDVTFGVRARFLRSSWTDLKLKAVLVHPALPGEVPEIESWEVWPWGDGSFFNTYTFFDQPLSDTGRWTLIVTDGKRRLHEVEFDVVLPSAVPELADVCHDAQVS